MPGFIVQSHRAKSPVQFVDFGKTRGFGQVTPVGNSVGEGWIPVLQKPDGRVNRRGIIGPEPQHPLAVLTQLLHRRSRCKQRRQPLTGEKTQDCFDAQVCLMRHHGTPIGQRKGIQVAFQIGSGRIRGIELGKRGRQQQHASSHTVARTGNPDVIDSSPTNAAGISFRDGHSGERN